MHWLTGVHIARETAENVERAGWTLDEVVPLTRADMFVRIEARKQAGETTTDSDDPPSISPQ